MAQVLRRISTSPGLGPASHPPASVPPITATRRQALERLYRIVPRIARPSGELARAPLDHRQGFVLSLVDGRTNVQGVIDVAGMPEDEVIATLHRLRYLGIVTLG
jgi:hypothetical protein